MGRGCIHVKKSDDHYHVSVYFVYLLCNPSYAQTVCREERDG